MCHESPVDEHPIRLKVEDDLHRSRLTVFFRLLLAIPHLIWFVLWSLLAIVLAIVGWIAALFVGRLPGGLHRFSCSYIRYSVHLTAYLGLVANPYPAFAGDGLSSYPVEVELPEVAPQRRWKILLRILLAIPALMIAATLGGGSGSSFSSSSSNGNQKSSAGFQTSGLWTTAAILGWFASLFTGRMPGGLRDAGAYAIGYRTQVLAYLLLVTERYPNADPTAMLAGLERPPVHPVHLVGEADDLRRSRVTILFRLPLLIPLLVWLVLWSIPALLALIVQWLAMLVLGRPVAKLHAFLRRFIRYGFHVNAFGSLAANPFPGFTGLPGVYPLDLVLPAQLRQSRWKTLFRIVLVIPAVAINTTLLAALVIDAILMWFVALATAKAPEGLRNLSAYALRYGGQTNAYFWLITDVYPHASPLEGAHADDVAAAEAPLDEAA
jgi:hypothetical protein